MLLLDTQVVIWSLAGSDRLGPLARDHITQSSSTLCSAATIFEVAIKSMLGKLSVPEDFLQSVLDAGMSELPISSAHAAAIGKFPELVRHDPFDRLLVAQALVDGLELLTADRVLLGLGRDFILDATQ